MSSFECMPISEYIFEFLLTLPVGDLIGAHGRVAEVLLVSALLNVRRVGLKKKA